MEWYEIAAVVFGPGGAVFVGIRQAFNGMRRDVQDIKGDIREVRDWVLRQGG